MTSLVNTETGEIVNETQVRASIERVIAHAESIWDEWAWQVENQTWLVLGYASWDDMRSAEYGSLTSVSAPRAERPELVSRFRKAGLTQQQTANTLGLSQRTVSNYDTQRQQHPLRASSNSATSDEGVIDAEIVEDVPRSAEMPDLPKFSDWMTENAETPEQGEASTAGSPFRGSDERDAADEQPVVPPAPVGNTVDLSDFINADPTVRLTSWRKHFMAAIAKSSDLLLFTPDDVAENAGVDLINELERLAADLNNYVSRVRAKRPTHLTALRGGKQ